MLLNVDFEYKWQSKMQDQTLICYVIYRRCCLAVSVQKDEKDVSGLLHSQVRPPAAVRFSLELATLRSRQ